MSDYALKVNTLAYALRHPDKPPPIRGVEMGLQNISVDDVVAFNLVLSRKQLNSSTYAEFDLVAFYTWLNDVMLPQLNQYAPVYLAVIQEGINDHEGDASYGE